MTEIFYVRIRTAFVGMFVEVYMKFVPKPYYMLDLEMTLD